MAAPLTAGEELEVLVAAMIIMRRHVEWMATEVGMDRAALDVLYRRDPGYQALDRAAPGMPRLIELAAAGDAAAIEMLEAQCAAIDHPTQ